MAEVPLRDLQVGTRYRMRDPIIIQNVMFQNEDGHLWIQGTIQEDLDRIHGGFFELERLDNNGENDNGNPENFDATFTIPINFPPIQVPDDLQEEGAEPVRHYIFLSTDALPDGDNTIFVTEDNENVPMNIIGGKRNKKHKQKKTKKQRKTRKQKKRSTRRRRV